MRKSNQEIKEWKVLEQILKGSLICRIAMMDQDRPYLLPFNYGYRERTIYIHSAPAGKKIDMLRENNQVCFEVEHTAELIKGEKACDWTTLYRSVVGYGTVEIIEDHAGKKEGLEIIMGRHGAPDLVDFNPGNLKRMVILKLTITSITGKQSGNWNRINSIEYPQ